MSVEQGRAAKIFDAAVELATSAERAAYLDRTCADDPQLRQEVEQLLQHDHAAGSFLETPAAAPLVGLEETLHSERPGSLVGPYKLLQQIGEGGMGTVFMAEQSQPVQRRVALKVIKPGMDSKQVCARFEAERQALALMDHVNIARVLDAGATKYGRPYFVMELVHGVPITDYCDDNHLTPRQRLELFVPVCQAIQHAHQKGIVHRDLKPSNVMITLYDGRPVPKVIDFGVAKAIEQPLTARTLFTQYGTVIGTLEYMSPEQAEMSALGVDTRSDIYSLGVLLYELLTGTTPLQGQRFREAAYDEILRIIREEEPPKPSTRLTDSGEALASISAQRNMEPVKLAKLLRGELDWIVMKSLEKDRERRYETANGFAADLQRYLADEVVLAGPPSQKYRLRKFARRYRRSLITAMAFGLLLLAAVAISATLAVKARDAKIQAEDDRDKAQSAERKAADAAANARSVLAFFQDRILAVGRPEGQHGGLGRDVTIRKAVDTAEPKIAEAFQDQPLVEAAVRNTLGMTYIYVGDPGAAIAQLNRASELRRDGIGPDSPEALSSLHDLGVAYRLDGQLERTEAVLEQVWHRRVSLLGESAVETLKTQTELALAYLESGKLAQANKLAAQAVTGLVQQLGEDNIDTLLSRSCLASTNEAVGKSKTAVADFESILAGFIRTFGPEHPYTLATINSLGLAYRAAGQLDLAAVQFTKALAIQKERLGPEHLHTLTSMHNLALIHINQGQAAKAIPLLLKVEEGRNTKLKPDHPNTLLTMQVLATAYQLAGQPERAMKLLENILERTKHKLGPDHPKTLHAMNNLAALNFFAGKIDRAIEIHEQTLRLRRATIGSLHADTLVSTNNLAFCYWKAKKTDLAIPLFLETIQGRTATMGQDHPQTVNVIITTSAMYRDIDQIEKSLQLLEDALKDRRSRLGVAHADTVRFAKEVATMQIALGNKLRKEMKFAEAEPLLRASLITREQLEPDEWTTFANKTILGGTLLAQKKFVEAEPLLLQGYEGLKKRQERIPAIGKPRISEALTYLVRLYEAQDRKEEAARWRKVLDAHK